MNNLINEFNKIFLWPKKLSDKDIITKWLSLKFDFDIQYSEKQVNAWAPSSSLEPDGLEDWKKKWAKVVPIVALQGDNVVGFTEFETNGHIDCFFVHHAV